MTALILFIVLTLAGTIVGSATGINPIEQSAFPSFAAFALAVGLYGSVVGIDLASIERRKWTAVIVITIAVPFQILATGAVMYLIYPMAISFLIAVAITQIDPLSVDTLLQDKESMSEEAKGVLRIWASFDDPVTVLFGFLILLPLVTDVPAIEGSDTLSALLYVALNTVPALIVWLLQRYTAVFNSRIIQLVVLVILLAVAFITQSYLLAATLGLLLRPIPEAYISHVISIFYYIIVFIVGMAIYSYGVDLRIGVLLAIVEFFIIQPMTALIVFNGTVSDIYRIGYAQQNGLTTLLMGIAFQSFGIPVLHILLPAIVAVNVMNLAVNKLFSWKEARGLIQTG